MTITINGQQYKLVPLSEEVQQPVFEPQLPQKPAPSLKEYVYQLVEELNATGRRRTAETYRSALNSIVRFLDGGDISMADMDNALMCSYERFLHCRGIGNNSSSFYMRVMRTIYNRAVAEGLISNRQPFARVYTGIGKTSKRALGLDIIKALYSLTGLEPPQAFARDIFLFSFYTRGMAFVDIAYLRPENIQNGMLTYRRHKTGQELTMRWEPQMQEIIDRNPTQNPDYLLPIIKRSNGRERNQYRQCQRMVNCMLHDIERLLQLSTKLTFYVARHSWASIARHMNIPINIISEGMGHTSERTTQIYLKQLDLTRLDSMNANIIRAVEDDD